MPAGLYHVWFSTKGRKHVLEGEVAASVLRLLRETAKRASVRLLEIEAAGDHAHVFVQVQEGQTLPSIMHQLKGATARAIFLQYPDLKFEMQSQSFWQKSYGWRKIGAEEIPAVRNYIRTQRSRPPGHRD